MALLRNMAVRVIADNRGHISTGKKSEKGYPQSLDYFDLVDFPELKELYGEQPKEMILYFPSDEIEDVLTVINECWKGKPGNGVKVRTCDGVECTHRIRETILGKTYEPGEDSECICTSLPKTIEKDGKTIPNPELCTTHVRLRAWVADPETMRVHFPTPYMFVSGSYNSGSALYSEMKKVLYLTEQRDESGAVVHPGHLKGVPFRLVVEMVEKKDESKKRFPIWSLFVVGTVGELRQVGRMLGSGEAKQLAEPEEVQSAEVVHDEAPTVFDDVPKSKAEEADKARKVVEGMIRTAKTVDALTKAWNYLLGLVKDGTLTEDDKRTLTEKLTARKQEVQNEKEK